MFEIIIISQGTPIMADIIAKLYAIPYYDHEHSMTGQFIYISVYSKLCSFSFSNFQWWEYESLTAPVQYSATNNLSFYVYQ